MKNVQKTEISFPVTVKLVIWFSLMLLVAHSETNAQDTIYFLKASPIVVKIIAIENRVVKYKSLTNPDGPHYVLGKRGIQKIVYGNGVEAILRPTAVPGEEKPFSWNFLKGQTHVNLIVSDLFRGFGGIEVEHNFFKGKVGIRVPLSIGSVNVTGIDSSVSVDMFNDHILFNGNHGYYNKNKTFSTGIGILIYTSGKDKINYFFGPSAGYGEFNIITTIYPPSWFPDMPIKYRTDEGRYFSYFFKNGVRIQPLKHLNIIVELGTGAYETTLKNSWSTHQISMEGSISVGYTF